MSSTRLFSWSFLVAAFAVLYLATLELVPTTLSHPQNNSHWSSVVNLKHNAYHLWKEDRITSYATELLNAIAERLNAPQVSPSLTQIGILFLGSVLCVLSLRHTRGIPHPSILLLSIVPVLLILYAVGLDSVVLGTLTWVPMLAMVGGTLLLAHRKGSLAAAAPLWLFGVALSIQHTLSANHVAFVSALGALGVAYLLATSDPALQTDSAPQSLLTRLPLVPLVLLGPALVVSFFTAPAAPFPDYPLLRHVVPDDGLDGIVRPLIGLDYPLPTIDREAVKASYGTPAAILFVIAITIWLLSRKVLRPKAYAACVAAIVLLASAVLDTALPEEGAAIAPIMSASRLLPWGTTLCLSSITLAAGAWMLGVVLVTNPRRVVASVLLIAALLGVGRHELRSSAAKASEYVLLRQSPNQEIIVSPSNAVFRRERIATGMTPSQLIEAVVYASQVPMQSMRVLSPALENFPAASPRILNRMLDLRENTGWSTSGKQQTGAEFISVTFQSSATIRGIELATGSHAPDFPRGLTILRGPCSAPGDTLATYANWQGQLALSPRGFPFYDGQHNVRVLFSEPTELTGVCIKQTAKSIFDWTVTELRFLPGAR